jgi:serine/threonine-protein kinase
MPPGITKPPDWNRIQDIFEEASQLPGTRRQEYIASACEGDRTLYLQVQSLLLALDEEGGSLENQIVTYATQVATAPPERIGPYRVVSEIARGGMGAVYLAERADEQYQRRVAIKLIRVEVASAPAMRAALLARFRVERQILAQLQHPNIAQMLDGGVTEDGTTYLVMEYVEGIRIDEYCDRNALSVRDRIVLFRNVCSAVEHAHRNLVVHRDIKPSNILVTAEGVPKLLDFGIAKLLRPGGNSQTMAMTGPADRLMTREYASPEQVRGLAITTAADVYALGVVLYELLAGAHPFLEYRSDFIALERAICETDPRPPSAAAAEKPERASDVRGDLDCIVLKAIRKQPEERYSSVDQFSHDLAEYLDGFPVMASQGTRRYRAVKFVRRHRFGVTAAAAFVLVLIVFGAAMGLLAARLKRETIRSNKVSEFLSSLFSSSDPYSNLGGPLTARELLDRGAKRLSKELAGEPELRVDLLNTIAQAYRHVNALDGSENMFRQRLEAVNRVYGPESEEAAETWRMIGDVQRLRGNSNGAELSLRRALAICEHLPAGKQMERAHALNNLALVLQQKGKFAEQEALLRRAVEISRKFPEAFKETLTMEGNLASSLSEQGKPQEAEALYREVIDGRRRLLTEKHPQVARSMSSLASTLDAQGKYGEAEQVARAANALVQARTGPATEDSSIPARTLAGILADEGSLAEAESLYRRTIQNGSAVENPMERSMWFGGLAWVLFQQGRLNEAEPLFRQALEATAIAGPRNNRKAKILEKYAELQMAQGRYDAARAGVEEARAVFQVDPGSTQANRCLFLLAEVDKAQGRRAPAEAAYQQVLAFDKTAPPNPLERAKHLLGYAEFLADGSRTDAAQAEGLAREAVDLRVRNLPPDFWLIDEANEVLARALLASGREREARPLAAAACSGLQRKLGADALPSLKACHLSRPSRSE